METSINKHLLLVVWSLSLFISLVLNFNLIGALVVRDFRWIVDNWLCDEAIFILPSCYLLVHGVLMLGYKSAMSQIN